MKFDELEDKCRPLEAVILSASKMIIGYQSMFDAAGISGDYVEMDRYREMMKTQIDIQCDAKISQFRLINQWKKEGAGR